MGVLSNVDSGERHLDFIVEADDGVVAIEVKLSAAVNDTHVTHLHWLRHELGDDCVERSAGARVVRVRFRAPVAAVNPLAFVGRTGIHGRPTHPGIGRP